jgi:hypothetical protein
MSSNPIASAIFITQSPRNGALSFLSQAKLRVDEVLPCECKWLVRWRRFAGRENMRPVNVLAKKASPGMAAVLRGRHAGRLIQM